MFLEKNFSPLLVMEGNEPQGMAKLDARDIVGEIYVGDH